MTHEFADEVEDNLVSWSNSLLSRISVADLFSRNAVAHKWKTPFRCMMLRETALWREHDLLSQSHVLFSSGHILGSRLLLRSGLETLATLIFMNVLMQQVIDGKLNFHHLGEKTEALLLDSRNNEQMPRTINVLTVLEKSDSRYPGLMSLYADLSESAHPSYEGLCSGYSELDYDKLESVFSNRWAEKHESKHLNMMMLCIKTFNYEYNEVWPTVFEKMEKWIVENDEKLEATEN